MQMILGAFLFSLETAAYQKRQRTSEAKWATNSLVGRQDDHQYLGPGADKISLPGVIYPELTGGTSVLSLDVLRTMKDSGEPQLMLSQYADMGFILGQWIILGVDQNDSFLNGDIAQKVEFTVRIKRYSGTEQFDSFIGNILNAI